jgi:membrane protease YdiL (CAAX protease family)
MRKDMKKYKEYYCAVFIPLLYFGIAFFPIGLIPFAADTSGKTEKILSYIIAFVFWVFLVMGIIAVAGTKQKLYPIRRSLERRGVKLRQDRAGIFTFSSEKPNLAVYTICTLGAVLIVLDIIFNFIPSKLMFPIISITAFSIALHGVIDGRNYKTIRCLERDLGGQL